MQMTVDLTDEQIEALERLSAQCNLPCADLIHIAINDYLAEHAAEGRLAFGLWRERQVDGLAYQQVLRGEWA